jgi:hypothetical protein
MPERQRRDDPIAGTNCILSLRLGGNVHHCFVFICETGQSRPLDGKEAQLGAPFGTQMPEGQFLKEAANARLGVPRRSAPSIKNDSPARAGKFGTCVPHGINRRIVRSVRSDKAEDIHQHGLPPGGVLGIFPTEFFTSVSGGQHHVETAPRLANFWICDHQRF